MKKTLLTTTAMGLLAAGTSMAAAPSVTVGGYADFQVGNASQSSLYEAPTSGKYSRETHTRTDTEIHINVDGKTDSGLGYGAHIELEADVNADDKAGTANNNSEVSYIYVESGFGRVEVGPNFDAASSLRINAGTLARATGGISGDFYKYVDLANTTIGASSNYYILPGLPTLVGVPGEANSGTNSSDTHAVRATANKINYFSPRIEGLQAGISYTPDQGERGTKNGFSGKNDGGNLFADVWNLGLNYEGQFDEIGISASITGEWGNSEDLGATSSTRDDLEAYAFGANLSYAGFTAGGSYGIADEFGSESAFGEELDYYTLGAAYEFGPFAASVTYFASEVENQGAAGTPDKEFSNLSVGADYQLAPGLVPYIEVSFFDTDNNIADIATTADNDGTVIIIGTELNF